MASLPCIIFFAFLSLLISTSQSLLNEQPETFIVHVAALDKPSVFASHHDWYHSALESLPPSSHPRDILYTYTNAMNGFAARLTPSQASHLRPVPKRRKGICEVGPDFPKTSCNGKIIGARAFYQGHKALVANKGGLSADVMSPRDNVGHGSHVASIAAGSVVKNARFYEYAVGKAQGMIQILKPDVIAPGINILAAWTGATCPTHSDTDKRRVEFNVESGTSMACPHVSGLAAMVLKAHPKWSPAAIRSALMTTAYNVDNSGLSDPGDLNYPSFISIFKSNSDTIKYKRTLKNVGVLGKPYQVRINAPASVKVSVTPNKLVFSSVRRSLSYEITFSSMIPEGTASPQADSRIESGSIEWYDGTHVVRSPIVFGWLDAGPPTALISSA
ncbi:subtilisin-like protease SBT1.4 [Papaver somniferum]|uniref:subtilisin-like protease SBT1.4 n=1 Tax=Papaver somniferum TaxID=3469 RepID=UPI000E6F9C4C|nr:subtilisin-like protease SBT1.4 [Papaver somniferum]